VAESADKILNKLTELGYVDRLVTPLPSPSPTPQLWELFGEIGRQQYALMAIGSTVARGTQAEWHSFGTSLLSGTGVPEIETAYDGLKNAIEAYNNHHQIEVKLQIFYNYFAAKIIRSIFVEPSELDQNWYFICDSTAIPAPGDFITVQIFQEPLVAVRQADGTIRVFLNVCTHRQAPVFEGQGVIGVDKLVLCPYHGWAFGIDGDCQNAPGANRGEFGDDFDLKNYTLQGFEVQIDREGRVFAKFAENVVGVAKDPPSGSHPQIGSEITKLLNSVSPGYADGDTATLPEQMRLWLRIGYLGAELKSLITDIAESRIDAPNDVRQLVMSSLRRELKQAILTVDPDDSNPELADVLQEVDGSDEAEQLIFAPTQTEASVGTRKQALPIWIYGDPALFALEVEHLIAPTWQFVCHVSEVPQAGNYTWLDIIGERGYVIRTEAGELFAGRLTDIAARGSYPQFGVAKYGLEPIDLEVFYGFIFIRLSWEGSRLAESWYQPQLLDPYRLEEMQLIGGIGRYDIDVEVDYKLLWENFLEDYHFPMMHKGLTRRFGVSSDCEGINGMIIPMRDPASPSLTPVERTYYDCAKAIAGHSWERERELQAFAAAHQALPARLCYSAFCSMSAQEETPMPFSLSVFPEHVQTFSLVPTGPRSCRFHVRSYGHLIDPDDPHSKMITAARLANIQLLIESLHEDIRVNYLCQDSVSSRLFAKNGVFSLAEFDVAKFQEAIRAKLPIAIDRGRLS
jgi:phenylpropionate dioxygenase-like ring-hydroxylating dioxygenase large terminal subunit